MLPEYWRVVLSNLIFVFGIIAAQILYAPSENVRSGYKQRLTGCIAANVLIVLLLTLTDPWQVEQFGGAAIINSWVFVIVAGTVLPICYKVNLNRMSYSFLASVLLMLVYSAPAKIVQNLWEIDGVQPVISLIKIISCAAIYVLMYVIYIRRVAADAEFAPQQNQIVALFIVTVCVLYTTFLETVLLENSFTMFLWLVVGQVTISIAILYTQYLQHEGHKKDKETAVELELRRSEEQQFVKYQQVVDMLNIKCHDLKHQIRELGDRRSVAPEVIEDLTKTAELYDAFVNTGNKTIDTVLTEKSLRCQALGIRTSWILDGKGLGYMSAYDINSLFGNALENAIEYLGTVPEDRRFISITCKPMGDMIHIQVTNYLEHPPKLGKDGLPETSRDKNYHGFGMKSMRATAEKYGGSLTVTLKEQAFCLNLFLECRKEN